MDLGLIGQCGIILTPSSETFFSLLLSPNYGRLHLPSTLAFVVLQNVHFHAPSTPHFDWVKSQIAWLLLYPPS